MTDPRSRSSDETVARDPESSPAPGERFSPGDVLDERYRIVALLGRGGMGEVYRADDLRLGQQVALKFLPRQLLTAGAIEKLYGEVRLGRKVSHPNVCRLYDVGEWRGNHFVTMEYIDGEDLASLLRRIGQLPHGKAVELAQDICAGLAAAHGLGVIHRDLKPANIMIDGRGNAVITDFGLAALAEDLEGRSEVAGTPAYMAPEQLAQGTATHKSDLYALGLILYEMFTGKRRFDGRSVEEMRRLHESSDTSTISRESKSVDPIVQQVIARCLEPNPEDRPRSIHSVIAALPGADPLQAALEAGETPSPEMVAAAGQGVEMSPYFAVSLFILGVVLLVSSIWITDRTEIEGIRPFPLHPRVLENEARKVLRLAGLEAPSADTNYLFVTDDDFFSLPPEERASWNPATINPPPITFAYRQSPEELVPLAGWRGDRRILPEDPPMATPGMGRVYLTPEGLLLNLLIIPTSDYLDSNESNVEWEPFFEKAGLDYQTAIPADGDTIGPVDVDERFAWKASYLSDPEMEVDVLGGRVGSRVVWFEILSPWTKSTLHQFRPPAITAADAIITFLIGATLIAALWFARRNLKRGRGNIRGALRLAAVLFMLLGVAYVLRADHMTSLTLEWHMIVDRLGLALFRASALFVLYLAIEPYLRRKWPTLMVSWNRLLAGHPRDRLVGRDILYGASAGLAAVFLAFLSDLLQNHVSVGGFHSALTSSRQALAATLSQSAAGLLPAFVLTILLVVGAIIFRRRWAGAVFVYAILTLVAFADGALTGPGAVLTLVIQLVTTLILFRLGLLAAVAYFSTVWITPVPMTLDTSAFFFATSLIPAAAIIAILLWGFLTSISAPVRVGDSAISLEPSG